MADGAQALVGVVLPVQQAVLEREVMMRYGSFVPFGYEVVHERADISVRAAEDHGLAAQQLQRRVHARDEALHGRLLIAGRAVELPRAVEAGHLWPSSVGSSSVGSTQSYSIA